MNNKGGSKRQEVSTKWRRLRILDGYQSRIEEAGGDNEEIDLDQGTEGDKNLVSDSL